MTGASSPAQTSRSKAPEPLIGREIARSWPRTCGGHREHKDAVF